ncbi:MAG: YcxB family protein, partial [Gammaproteobacteria bacterium]
MFEIEYEFREEDLIHFNEIQFMRSDEIQNNIRKNRLIVPGMLVLFGFFYYVYYSNFMSAAYAVGIAILWALLSPKIIMLDLRRQILKSYTEKERANMFGAYTLTIDPQYLIEKSPSGKHKMAWSELVRVEREGKRYVYIYISLNTALVIPVDAVKKGNLDEFACAANS